MKGLFQCMEKVNVITCLELKLTCLYNSCSILAKNNKNNDKNGIFLTYFQTFYPVIVIKQN
jgi:hypothetical protein